MRFALLSTLTSLTFVSRRLLWFKNMERDDGAGVGLDLGYSPSHANEELIAWHKHMEGLFAELADTALSTDGPNVECVPSRA